MLKTLHVSIPARKETPETSLYVKIIAQDEKSLQTKPYVFMLPGGPGLNHSHYKDYGCLKDVSNIVFHDPRGCGLSEKGDMTTYTMENYIEDINIIRQHLELSQIHLVGKSYGAMCALGYTLRYPATVLKLVLAAGSPSFRCFYTAQQNFLSRHPTVEQKKVCETLWNGAFTCNEDLMHYLEVMSAFYSYKKRQGENVERPAPDLPCAFEPLNQGFGGFLREFDFENQLSEVKSDTLILVGDEDWITDKKHSQVMADNIPNNKFIIFPHAGHSMESDVPELFFNAIREFLRL